MSKVSDSILEAHRRGEHEQLSCESCGLCLALSSPGRPAVPPSDAVPAGKYLQEYRLAADGMEAMFEWERDRD